jgi:hypothetical protein
VSDIDLEDLVRRGVAVMVATRDVAMRPEIGRAWGPEVSGDGDRLIVCVEAPPDSSMARNLKAGAPVAAMITRLASRATVTLRGPVVTVAAPDPARLAAVSDHVTAFVAELASVGVPERIGRAMVSPDLQCVSFEMAERLDEPRGPGADRFR